MLGADRPMSFDYVCISIVWVRKSRGKTLTSGQSHECADSVVEVVGTSAAARYAQVRLLDEPGDLELLGCGIPHSWSSPPEIMLFLSSRFSSRTSANASLRALILRRSSLTSLDVAWRSVSPEW